MFLCPYISCKLVVRSKDSIESRFEFLSQDNFAGGGMDFIRRHIMKSYLFVMFSANDDHFLCPLFGVQNLDILIPVLHAHLLAQIPL